MSVGETQEFLKALTSALRFYERTLKKGSVLLGGAFPKTWYFDPNDKEFWQDSSTTVGTTTLSSTCMATSSYRNDNPGRVKLTVLKDGTFTIREGKVQIRRLPDGNWVWRIGTGEWGNRIGW